MQADVIIEIPFHDVDTMNVVWHGHYLKYFEKRIFSSRQLIRLNGLITE